MHLTEEPIKIVQTMLNASFVTEVQNYGIHLKAVLYVVMF